MKYQKAVTYLNSFINFEKQIKFNYNRLKLARVRSILAFLGNPQKKLKVIKVVGTKGKGSTANYISTVLSTAGYKTGLYTSPHLYDFRERIRIDGKLISKSELVAVVGVVKKAIDRHLSCGRQKPTFFEVYTICAFYFFYTKKTDFVVLEAGLGGRLDATNVARGIISVVTPISYEHMDKLGKQLKSIAFEKASIIDDRAIVICAQQRFSVLKTIKFRAAKKKAKLFVFSKDFKCRILKQSINGQSFSYSGLYGQLSGLNITLLGEHQLENAACALAAIESLVFLGYKIDNKHIRKGLDLARWPGRLEVVYKKPLVVLDGAQNKASMLVLFGSLRKIFKYKKLFIILGISADKDIKGISRVVEAETQHIILTKSRHPRAAEPENIKRYFKKNKKEEIKVTNSLKDALNLSFKLSNKNDLIICCGSLFVVAEARKLLMKKNENKRII